MKPPTTPPIMAPNASSPRGTEMLGKLNQQPQGQYLKGFQQYAQERHKSWRPSERSPHPELCDCIYFYHCITSYWIKHHILVAGAMYRLRCKRASTRVSSHQRLGKNDAGLKRIFPSALTVKFSAHSATVLSAPLDIFCRSGIAPTC